MRRESIRCGRIRSVADWAVYDFADDRIIVRRRQTLFVEDVSLLILSQAPVNARIRQSLKFGALCDLD